MESNGWGHHENWVIITRLTHVDSLFSLSPFYHFSSPTSDQQPPSFRRERSLWMSVAKLSLKSTAKW